MHCICEYIFNTMFNGDGLVTQRARASAGWGLEWPQPIFSGIYGAGWKSISHKIWLCYVLFIGLKISFPTGFIWCVNQYILGLLRWRLGNRTIAPMPVEKPRNIWVKLTVTKWQQLETLPAIFCNWPLRFKRLNGPTFWTETTNPKWLDMFEDLFSEWY